MLKIDSVFEVVDMSILDKKVLAPGIVEFQFLEQSAFILKTLIDDFASAIWEKAKVLNVNKDLDINYSARRCYIKFINRAAESCHPQDPLAILWNSLEVGIQPMFEEYRKMYSLKELNSLHWQLTKYEKDDMFHGHFDDSAQFPRVLSVSIFLNDDYLGGDLIFEHFNLNITPKAGKVIFFSSSHPYMHLISPVISGVRYSAVRWYNHSGKEMIGT